MFRKIVKSIVIILSVSVIMILLAIVKSILSGDGTFVLELNDKKEIKLPSVVHKGKYNNDNIGSFPELLHIKGNKIVNFSEEVVILKGVNVSDPSKLYKEDKFNKEFFQGIKDTGANIIRIPVLPERYYEDKDYFWRYLDPIVTWTGELKMYVIFDMHFIGNIENGLGKEMPDIDIHPKYATVQFWTQTASYFKDVPHVVFDIYNEPTNISAQLWSKNANEIVKVIRRQGANQIIIVAGTYYSKDLSWVKEHPIDDENIVYASHIYPIDKESMWEHYFGEISEKYPVLVTEWGFMDKSSRNTKQVHLVGDEKTYAAQLINYLDEKEIGWLAWCYDDTWEPRVFNKDFKTYTKFGEFLIEKLNEK